MMEDLWELQKLWDEVRPYLRMVLYWYPDMERVRKGVERAKEIISTLGDGYYETHLRSVLEAYIYKYENFSKEELSLEDVMLEDAYPSTVVEVLERGMEAFLKESERAKEAAFAVERAGIVEEDARYTEFPIDIGEMLRFFWEKLEEMYGEEAPVVFDPSHSDRLMSMVGEGKVIIGYAKLPAVYFPEKKKLLPHWYRILDFLAEEYIHLYHYRKVKDLPALFVNLLSHSEEIWVGLEKQKVVRKLARYLSDAEMEIVDIFTRLKIGIAKAVYSHLKDLYLYLGDVEAAKELVEKFRCINPERKDWKIYFQERMKEVQALRVDLTEDLKYIIYRALLLEGREPPPWWLERGKVSSRAMELLELL